MPFDRATPCAPSSPATRGVLLVLCSVLLAACGGGEAGSPNLLFVVFDTTRADHLTPYGSARDTSPHVAALAERGLLCRSAWAHSSLTSISSASFLTGTLPPQHGVRSLFGTVDAMLSDDVTTLAERLQTAGWRTAAFISAPTIDGRYGFRRGFDVWGQGSATGGNRRAAQGLGNAHQRRADETTDEALEWLRGDADGPFAMLVHYFDAHDATLVPPREFLEAHVSFPLPPDLDEIGHLTREEDPARRIELYDAEIRWMDFQFGRLLGQLEDDGRLENTLVVFLADHGEGLGQHGFWTHGLLWSEQLHVPLVFAGPGVPRAERLDADVRLVDVLPTIAELFDLPLGADLAGASILELVGGDAELPPRPLYAEVRHTQGDFLGRNAELYSLTVGRWKYVSRPTRGEDALFDLEQDPGETVNRIEQEPRVAAELAAQLAALGAAASGGASLEGVDPARLEELRALGYVGPEPEASPSDEPEASPSDELGGGD